LESEINVNKDVCIFRAPVAGGVQPNHIRFPCFICRPNTKGFSRARDLVKHSVCSHDLFTSKVQQGYTYICDGRDLVAATPEQLDKYRDGSHRGRKKLEEVDKAEAERKLAEAKTKVGEKAKKGDNASTSRDVDVSEMMRRREVQVEILNEGKAEARMKEELLEVERIAADKNIQLEEQQKNKEEKKKRVKEEWQKNARLAEEERKKEDIIQFKKSLAKMLALEGSMCETGGTKKIVRKEMSSEEIDQEFREINAGQVKVNTRLAIEQIVESKPAMKYVVPGSRMMRAEGGEKDCLPPVSVLLGTKGRGAGRAKTMVVGNVRAAGPDKVEKKILNIPESVVEEMDLDSGEEEEDFQKEQRNDVRIEIPQDILSIVERSVLKAQGGGEIKPVEALSTTFLKDLV